LNIESVVKIGDFLTFGAHPSSSVLLPPGEKEGVGGGGGFCEMTAHSPMRNFEDFGKNAISRIRDRQGMFVRCSSW
jgi:hypothetical protein